MFIRTLLQVDVISRVIEELGDELYECEETWGQGEGSFYFSRPYSQTVSRAI